MSSATTASTISMRSRLICWAEAMLERTPTTVTLGNSAGGAVEAEALPSGGASPAGWACESGTHSMSRGAATNQ